MNQLELYNLAIDYIDEQAKEMSGEGYEFDSLVFWNQVTDAEKEHNLSFQEAYDKVSDKYSFLFSSRELIAAYEAFEIHRHDGNY